MALLTALFDRTVKTAEEAFRVKSVTTHAMNQAIKEWYDLYYDDTATETSDPSQRLPVSIVSKLTKTTFSEYNAAPVDPEGEKGEYIAEILTALGRCRKKAIQQAFIGGRCYLKPNYHEHGLSFAVVNRLSYLVLAQDENGEPTDICLSEKTTLNERYYTLLERRQTDTLGHLAIENRLYMSYDGKGLGVEVPLTTLERYAALLPLVILPEPVYSLGLIPLSTPLENCVDDSSEHVSIYAPAAGLIRAINLNEAQINGEFSRGKSRIFVSDDLLKRDRQGRRQLKDNLFVKLDSDPEDSPGITIFSPALREQSYLNRKREYLRNIETVIGIKRGILSEVEAVERTATEITSSEGDYSLTIQDFQEMWEIAVKEALRVCPILGRLYGGWTVRELSGDDVAITWGNGVLYDEDKERSEDMAMAAAGMLKPEIVVAKRFNLPWETEEDLKLIREKYMPGGTEEEPEDGDE